MSIWRNLRSSLGEQGMRSNFYDRAIYGNLVSAYFYISNVYVLALQSVFHGAINQ